MIQEMMVPRGAVKFSAKCKEIDRQYEQNNNADLDNGVYHLDDEEEGGTVTDKKPAGVALATEDRPSESRLRSRVHDEASIADSFN